MSLAAAIAASSSSNPITGATGPKISSRSSRASPLDAGQHGRLVEVARAVARRAADDGLARPCRARRARARRPCRAACASISGPTLTSSSVPRPTFIAPSFAGQLLGELVRDAARRRGSGWPPCTPRPCCASSRSARPRPRRRRRRRRRRGTARCRPAPSTCAAAPRADCSTSLRPDLGRAGERELAQPRIGDDRLGDLARRATTVTTFSTPAGQPGLLEDLRQREHRQRRLLRRLDHHRAARRDRRADLARAHRHREVPRRDRVARARPAGAS